VAEEVPTAILYNGESFAVMMTSPTDLKDFAVGFTLTEGVAARADDIADIRVAEAWDGYIVNLRLPEAAAERVADRRRTIPGRSGCGVCGAQTLAAALPAPPRVDGGPRPSPDALRAAFDALPAHQTMNRLNRSCHAAAFCRLDGTLDLVREDIGRHNALDKLAGALARAGRSAAGGFVVMSSRCSVELVQKAAAIGVPFLASISAPSALALRTAARAGLGLAALNRHAVMMFDPDALGESVS
jgi:FdhD protein